MRLRRIVVGLVVVALSAAVVGAPPAGAVRAPKAKAVTGTFDGAGGFVFEAACPLIVYASSGTYAAERLGRGTYTLRFCIESGALDANGTFELVTRRGAQLHGVIDAQLVGGPNPVPVTINGGTKRFRGATGSLELAITQFDLTQCDPRVPVCLAWKEHADITGTITKPRRHKK